VTLPAVAVKAALVDPAATVTVGGTVKAAALLASTTVTPPLPAALDRFAVHVDVPLEPRLVGAQDSRVKTAGATREIDAVCELPLYVAVICAVWSAVMLPAVAVNAAVPVPGATNTLPGTVNPTALLDSVTVAPPAPEAFDKLTVQLDAAPGPRLVGAHDTALTRVGATREIDAVCELPLSVAVITAAWSEVMVPAVALKLAVPEPAGTVTAAGTVKAGVLLDSKTVAPFPGAD
jgi:hypothetical protein